MPIQPFCLSEVVCLLPTGFMMMLDRNDRM